MSPEEWHRIAEERFKQGLSLRRMATLVPWAAHGLDAASRQEAFAEAGKRFEVLWRLSRGRFERAEQQAFRYLGAG